MELCSMLCASLDWRGFWGRIDVCMYMAESLRCLAETTTTLLIGYTSIQNKNFKVWKKQKKVKSGLWSQTKLDSGISLVFHCGGPGSITGVRTKILQMVWCGQKKKEKKEFKSSLTIVQSRTICLSSLYFSCFIYKIGIDNNCFIGLLRILNKIAYIKYFFTCLSRG